jgi:hypothetical protein
MPCLAIIPVGAYISLAFPIPWHPVEDHVKCFRSGPLVVVLTIGLFLICSGVVYAQSSCRFSATPSILRFDHLGDTAAGIRVEASSSDCYFTAGSKFPWITVSQAKGGEPGVVTIRVEGNMGPQHCVGSVMIDGTEVDVVQEGPVITGDW